MEIVNRPLLTLPRRTIALFVAIFAALYAGAAGIAEVTVARSGSETAFQKLLPLRGTRIDWVVLGASHALPLAYGDVPRRLQADTGQSMAVLAEVGAGPVYNRFVFRQALQDIAPQHLLYVADDFAVTSPRWNEERLSDRKLLRHTPFRLSTARHFTGLVLSGGQGARGLADYLTGFSKLNPPDRFPQGGWRGAADFDRRVRLSRVAIQNRIAYLYPEQVRTEDRVRYLDILASLFAEARAAGVEVTVVRLPLPDAFRAALPAEETFAAGLEQRLEGTGVAYHDLSGVLSEPQYFFDTDHLNRAGIDALYDTYLRALLSVPGKS